MCEKIVALVAVICLFVLIVKCCDRSEDLNSNSNYPIYEESTETSTTQADSNSNKKETKKNNTYESSYHFHEYQGYGDEVDDEYEGADYDDYDTNWYDDYDNDEDEHWAD